MMITNGPVSRGRGGNYREFLKILATPGTGSAAPAVTP
jgi:hypothetical protein